MPRFTVATWTFNRPDWLAVAMRSVLGQTFQDFEYLVIDDASGPGTREVVLGVNDPRVRYVRNDTNRGILHNTNLAMDLARGDFFCILNDDDRYVPHCLDRLAREAAAAPDVDAVAFNCRLSTDDGRVVDDNYMKLARDVTMERFEYVRRHVESDGTFHIPGTVAVSRRLYGDLRLRYRPDGYDVLYSLEVNCHAPIRFVSEPLYQVRIHGTQDSALRLLRPDWLWPYYDQCAALLERFGLEHERKHLRRYATASAAAYVGAVAGDAEVEDWRATLAKLKGERRWLIPGDPWLRLVRAMLGEPDEGAERAATDEAEPSVTDDDASLWADAWEQSCLIGKPLHRRGARRVAIFGTMMVARLLRWDLERAGCEVVAFIDNKREITRFGGVPVHRQKWLRDAEVDAVVVSIQRPSWDALAAGVKADIGRPRLTFESWRTLLGDPDNVATLLPQLTVARNRHRLCELGVLSMLAPHGSFLGGATSPAALVGRLCERLRANPWAGTTRLGRIAGALTGAWQQYPVVDLPPVTAEDRSLDAWADAAAGGATLTGSVARRADRGVAILGTSPLSILLLLDLLRGGRTAVAWVEDGWPAESQLCGLPIRPLGWLSAGEVGLVLGSGEGEDWATRVREVRGLALGDDLGVESWQGLA